MIMMVMGHYYVKEGLSGEEVREGTKAYLGVKRTKVCYTYEDNMMKYTKRCLKRGEVREY
jgi:hypothetical protein